MSLIKYLTYTKIIIVHIITLILLVVFFCYFLNEEFFNKHGINFFILISIIIIIIVYLLIWFINIFTGDPTKDKFEKMIIFGYCFPFIFLAGMFIFFIFISDLCNKNKEMINLPIGLVLGCSQTPLILPIAEPPYGIRCDNATDQWLINIGGKVVNKEEASCEKELLEQKNKDSSTLISFIGSPIINLKIENVQPLTASQTPEIQKCSSKTTSSIIQGGLVVPLYIIVIAVFGGAVSMLRRVPEYQSINAENMLSNTRVRESLVFQIMQVFTAPIIAITAFYLFDPNSKASSLSLAFLAGFSSETVLIVIRSIVEKLRPETTRDLPKIEVTPGKLDFKNVAINTTSTAQTVTLANRTNAAISGSISGLIDFSCTPNGAFTVQPNNSLAINVVFKPTSVDVKNENLQIKVDSSGTTYEVHLTGTGIVPS